MKKGEQGWAAVLRILIAVFFEATIAAGLVAGIMSRNVPLTVVSFMISVFAGTSLTVAAFLNLDLAEDIHAIKVCLERLERKEREKDGQAVFPAEKDHFSCLKAEMEEEKSERTVVK